MLYKNDAVFLVLLFVFNRPSQRKHGIRKMSWISLIEKNATKEYQNLNMAPITMRRFLHGKTLRDAYQKGSTIDRVILKHMQEQKQLWKDVRMRFVDFIKFLATQHLVFRGHREVLHQVIILLCCSVSWIMSSRFLLHFVCFCCCPLAQLILYLASLS